jgi:hypothetical protein
VVDIGASGGIESDPVYSFITNPAFKGLCIEGNLEKVEYLRRKTACDVCSEYIYPHNILSIFSKFNVPIDIDILKIDIDGFDLEVIRKILEVYKPKIIIAEINEKIPPPIIFEVLYKDNYAWDESHFFGFSIKAGEVLMKKHGYSIIDMYDLNNILCVNSDLSSILVMEAQSVDELYEEQYTKHPKRLEMFSWNSDVSHWLEIKDKDALKDNIIEYFCNNNNRSRMEIKTKERSDFVIDC